MKGNGHMQTGPQQVLLVEDYADTRKLVRIALQNLDVELHMAEDGVFGMALYWKLIAFGKFPEVVLIDLGLPRLDGLSVIRRIRTIEADVPCVPRARLIPFTAYGRDAAEFKVLQDLDYDDYIVKPFKHEDLIKLFRAKVTEQLEVAASETIS